MQITAEEKDQFENLGYLAVPNALSPEKVSRLIAVMDELTCDRPEQIHNVADVLGRSDEFLDLIDLPTVFPKVQKLLGENIWVNHSHFNINPPSAEKELASIPNGYGWHRDGGSINVDVPPPAPLLSIKVGFYLTDLSEVGRGQTYLIQGSHRTGEKPPGPQEMPPSAYPLCVKPGTAMLYDRRTIHSIRSPNLSNITRRVIFIQYAFRWLCPVDAMTVEHLRDRCNAVRLQLLGISSTYQSIDGAAGRSGRYYPSTQDVAVGYKMKDNLLRQLRWWGNRILGRKRI